MPGLSLAHNFTSHGKLDLPRTEASLAGLLHRPVYQNRTLLSQDDLFLAATTHPAYPITELQDQDFHICLDGAIYHHSQEDLSRELFQVARIISQDGQAALSQLARWLKDTDGEFVIFIREKKTGRIHLLNDLLGLLPCFYRLADDCLYFSRDVRFITGLVDDVAFDRLAMAQYLILGYNLGRKTHFADIHRYPPASLLSVDPASGQAQIKVLHDYNYENEAHAGRSPGENITNLVELFDHACQGRLRYAQGSRLILSLSGGRDSRAVCAGLARNNAEYEAISFSQPRASGSVIDVQVAQEVAQSYGLAWQHIKLPLATADDIHRLLMLKSGFNGLEMGHVVVFLRSLYAMFQESITYVTGDTGLAPKGQFANRKLSGVDDLLTYIVCHDGYFSLRSVARLLQLKPGHIREYLRTELESYPERAPEYKFLRYRLGGRGLRYHTEGMDRNRCYFWLMSPLESPTFKNYLIGCPQEQKKGMRLYDLFLTALSDKNRGARLKNGHVQQEPIKPAPTPLLRRIVSNLPLDTKAWIKRNLLRTWEAYPAEALPPQLLKSMFQGCAALGEYFSQPEAEKILKTCSRLQLDCLLSLASVIEECSNGTSSLQSHGQTPFA